jgi:hypothetical protein
MKRLPQKAAPQGRQKLIDTIEAQREQIGRVQALLMCLAVALREFDDPFNGSPLFAEVANIGVDILGNVHEALEPGVLRAGATAPL